MSPFEQKRPADRTLYARGYGLGTLRITFWPVYRHSFDRTEEWWVWSPSFHFDGKDPFVGASRIIGTSWCYEPHEVLDGYIREAQQWAAGYTRPTSIPATHSHLELA